jgi:competence protein ComEC
LIGGLSVLVFSFVNPIAAGLGFCLSWIVKALNGSVFFVESFPFSLIENVYLTTFQCWLIILVIFSLIFLVEFRRFQFLVAILFLVTLLSFQQGKHLMGNSSIQKLTVYNISGHSAIDIFEQGKVYTFLDSALSRDQESIRFHIRPNRLASSVNKVLIGDQFAFYKKFEGGTVIKRNAISVLWINEKNHQHPVKANLDFLIVSNNAMTSLEELTWKPTVIIIDSSNSSYLAKKLTSQAEKLGLSVHNTHMDGAFVFKQKL